MPKNPLMDSTMQAIQRALPKAKRGTKMKPSKARPKASSPLVTAVNPSMSGN
jgi:hypothetical protein